MQEGEEDDIETVVFAQHESNTTLGFLLEKMHFARRLRPTYTASPPTLIR